VPKEQLLSVSNSKMVEMRKMTSPCPPREKVGL